MSIVSRRRGGEDGGACDGPDRAAPFLVADPLRGNG
jgi:hypothetical protein